MRVFGKVLLIMVPILLVLGLIAVAVSANHDFVLPRTNDFVSAFENLQSLQWANNMLSIARNFRNSSADTFNSLSHMSINNLIDFFSAMGVFFTAVGQFFASIGYYIAMVGSYIIMPFELIGWVFGSVWGWIPQQA